MGDQLQQFIIQPIAAPFSCDPGGDGSRSHSTISLDRSVCDYLLRAVKPRKRS